MHSNLLPKVAIIGAGEMGASFAHALVLSGCNPEIIFIDRDQARAEERVLDLQQSVLFSFPREIRAGTLGEVGRADVMVICAEPESGTQEAEHLARSLELIQEVAWQIETENPDAIILVGGTPIDFLTYAASKASRLPRRQVIGTGTIVKTATLRYLLGQHFRVDPRSVHAYILGGDGGEFPIWSSASVAGMPVSELCRAHGCSTAVLNGILAEVLERTRIAADARRSHFSGGVGLARIAAAILRNENHVCPVSTVLHNEYGLSDVAVSVPVVLNEKGIDRILRVDISDDEVDDFLAAARKNLEALKKIRFVQRPTTAQAEAEVC